MRANQLNDRLCVLAAREANRAIQTRAAVRAVAEGGEDLAAHAAPHGGDVAHAAARYPGQVSGLLGMSVKVLLDTFGHHHPGLHARGRGRDYLEGSQAERFGGRNGGSPRKTLGA
ncbi:hypothetical protein ACQR2B_10235 [Bradyrhizobium oligotrophicum]|uniref:hypothetical protein n=1 Tax=Bradyrhizobium TaxID=374 RepID=UPI0028E5A97D|nr:MULTISPECIES: hypothetical protein [unclassified Bradyrhizobium]